MSHTHAIITAALWFILQALPCGSSGLDVDCGDPGTPDHATKLGTTYKYMYSVHFECDPGFMMVGDESRICYESGQLLKHNRAWCALD